MAKEVLVWAESEAEVRDFLELTDAAADFSIAEIRVAKRTRGRRDVGNEYISGVYFEYDRERGATTEQRVQAPEYVAELVQWCSPDIILTDRKKALLAVESTYHELTFNNVAQRIPRVVRSAMLGIPGVIFQKLADQYASQSFVTWFAQTFIRATEIYGAPCLALTFTDESFGAASEAFVRLVNAAVNESPAMVEEVNAILADMHELARDYNEAVLIRGERGTGRRWLQVTDDAVTVNIGVRDNCALTRVPGFGCQGNDADRARFRQGLADRPAGTRGCVWLSKGTGGMDPYPGLVKMAELLLCFDGANRKIRRIGAHFSRLPEQFWWFARNPDEIYYRLVREFSETLTYAQDYS